MRDGAMVFVLAAVAAATVWAAPAEGQARRLGIEGQAAPAWGVREWINLPEGKERLDVSDFRGRVVYLYGFQSWCPGCHRHGFPTLQALIERFEGVEDVAFVAVQTTFEGFGTNTARAAWKVAGDYDLEIPVGHSGARGVRSPLMERYRTGGTPWTIIIDKGGTVRFNDFHVSVEAASALIDELRREEVEESSGIETLAAQRGGQDLVGVRMPELDFDGWVSAAEEAELPDAACGAEWTSEEAGATLYRWWTDTCPHCARSLPAIESLRKRFEEKGLRVVAVYHPKPPREVTKQEVREAARRLGYRGCVAIDRDWSELRRFYLDTGRRRATSASFVTDGEGAIRFVHPGPVFFPSNAPEHRVENRDYELLEQAIEALVADGGRASTEGD